MAGTPPTPNDSTATPDPQAAIDALLQGAAGESGDAATPSAPGATGETADEFGISQADIDALMQAAGDGGLPEPAPPTAAAAPQASAPVSAPVDSQKFEFPEFAAPPSRSADPKKISMLHDVKLRVKVELGRTRMLVEDVLELGEGSVVELDKLAGDPVDVYANERLVARGEVLVLNDTFCVRVSEVVSNDPHRISA